MSITTVLQIDTITMLGMSIAVLFVGMWLTSRLKFLANNHIPPAVTGGLVFSLGAWGLDSFAGIQLEFDMQLRDLLLLVFFTTVGLSARVSTLLRGGRTLVTLVLLAGAMLFLQNLVGVATALLLDIKPGYGLMAGSVSLAGGHGTATAWGTAAEAAGLESATEIGLIFATFGLICGGLLGGPIAHYLIKRDKLESSAELLAGSTEQLVQSEQSAANQQGDTLLPILHMLLILSVCVTVGAAINHFLFNSGLLLPGFLTTMLAAILITNTQDVFKRPINAMMSQAFGAVSLNIFLTMSMMDLHLWYLSGAVGKVTLVLTLQVAVMALFTVFVVYRLCGRDYDAAVISAGFVGLGLGATPVALANMDAITRHYGPSTKALIVVPLVGAFFIDMLNAGTINFFVSVFQNLQ